MRILLVEDDYLQADALREALTGAFKGVAVEVISTELKFRNHLDLIAEQKPDLIILDIMLRWTDPAPDLPPPPEDVAKEGFRRAGVRCQRLIKNNPQTRDIPIILYSVLEKADLKAELQDSSADGVTHIPKNSNPIQLMEKIANIIRPRQAPQRARKALRK